MANRTPQVADFYEFASKRRELFTDDVPQAIATLRRHPVYRWLRANPDYRLAEQKLAATSAFKAQLPDGPAGQTWPAAWELLWFASLVAQCLGEYYQARLNPARSRVITKADCRKAIAAASTIGDLIERGLEVVGEPGDTATLYELLEKIPKSPASIVVASRKAGKHAPTQTLARVLGQLLHAHYERAMPVIVHKAVQIVEPTISLRAVRRQLEALQ